MVMWLIMRGALNDDVTEVHRHYHVPASNTAVGHIILENTSKGCFYENIQCYWHFTLTSGCFKEHRRH